MKKSLFLIFFPCALLFASNCAANERIATIDLRKVFDGYWRTRQADANLKEQAGDLEKERQVMLDEFQKSEVNYKKLLENASDAALSASERDRRKKESDNELLALREMEARLKQFDNTARTTLTEKQRRMRDNILQEIRDTVKANIKTSGYTLVLDTAAETVNGTPVILFNAGADDITDTVLSQLNINAPLK